MSDSPAAILFDDNGNPVAVREGDTISATTPAVPIAGNDGTNSHIVHVNSDGSVKVDISSSSVSLPTGAATETTLSSRLADSTFTGRINTQGQKTMAASTPVVIASDQSAVKIDGSAVTQPVSGTITANIGTSGSLALDATLTGGTQRTKITDGTNNVAVKAASTAAVAADPALVVAISPNNTIPVTTTTADVTASSAVAALNAAVSVAIAGRFGVGFQLTAGTLIGTIVPELSFDGGTNWVSTYFDLPNGSKSSSVVFASSNTLTTGSIVTSGGASHARVRVSAFTSGTATLSLRASTASDPTVLFTTLVGTALPPTVAHVGGSVTTGVPSYTNGTINSLSLTTSGLLRTDNSSVTQPISAVSLPLPTGAATETTLSSISGKLPTSLVSGRLDQNIGSWLGSTAPTIGSKTSANSIPVVIASDQSALPISGTIVTSDPSVAAVGASVPSSAQLNGGSVSLSAPTYTAGQLSPLSLTTTGLLRVDASNTTQTVSGTVTANIGSTNGLALDATLTGGNQKAILRGGAKGSTSVADVTSTSIDANTQALHVSVTGTPTVNIGTIAGISTETTLSSRLADSTFTGRINTLGQKVMTGSTPVVIASDQSAITITGTVTANNSSVTTTGTTTPSSAQLIGGSVTTSAPTYTSGQMNALSLTTGGLLRVDSSGTTQTVQGTGSFTVAQATAANLNATVVGTVTANIGTIAGISTETTLSSRLADSTFTGRINTLGQKAMAASTPVVIASDQSAITVTGTVTASNPSVGTTGAVGPSSATYIGGAVTTSAPTYTTGQMNPLSLTTSGALRTDGSGVTQPVSGTITANIGTSGSLALDATLTGGTQKTILRGGAKGTTVAADVTSSAVDANTQALHVAVTGTPTVSISGTPTVTANLGTIAGVSTETTLSSRLADSTFTGRINTQGQKTMAASTPVVIASDQSALTVTGTVTASNPSVSTTGAAGPTSATYIGGSVTTAAPTYTTGQMNALSLTTSGALRTDGSAVTQPVSGTITANIGTSGSLALDATLTGGTQKAILRGGAKGTTTAADVTSSAVDANTQALHVAVTGTPAVSISGTPTVTANLGTIAGVATETTLSSRLADSTFTGRINTLGQKAMAASTPVVIASDQSALTVTGTVTASNPSVSTTGAAGPASATYIAGSVTTAAPTYTTGQMNALSLTTSGLLRVDSSATTQTVQGTGSFTVAQATAANLNATVVGTVTANLGTIAGVSTETTLSSRLADSTFTGRINTFGQKAMAASTPVVIASDQSAITVTGTVTASNPSVSATGAAGPASATYIGGAVTTAAPTYTTGQMNVVSLTTSGAMRVDGSGSTQPISGTVTANLGTIAGVATETTLSSRLADSTFTGRINTQGQKAMAASTPVVIASDQSALTVTGTVTANNASVATLATTTPTVAQLIGGAVTTAAPTYTTGQLNALSLTTGGLLRVDASGTNQTIIQSTASNLNALVQQGAANIANSWFQKITDGTNTVAVKAGTAPSGSDSALVVAISPIQPVNTVFPRSTSVLTNVAAATASTTLLAANASRAGAMLFNDSTSMLYVKFGTTASTTSFTVKMGPASYYELPFNYTGIITGIWSGTDGAVRVTEIS